MRSVRIMWLAGVMATALAMGGAAAVAAPPAPAEPAPVELAIGPIATEGPAVVPVDITFINSSSARASNVAISFAGPVGWTVYPGTQEIKKAVGAGESATVTVKMHVPSQQPGFTIRTFTASATYKGGDGAGSATVTRQEITGQPLDNLQAAYDNVGSTDLAHLGAGNIDGEGNSFSDEQLAANGIVAGARIQALGATFTWPSTDPGAPDNATGGKTVKFSGQGSRLAFLGTGIGSNAVGTATVWYSDGTSSSASVGMPNWSFSPNDGHGATLVLAMDGRNTPAGYANAEYKYKLFANSIAIDPAKTVTMVTLPAGGLHLFDMALVP